LPVRVGILIASDRASGGEYRDLSGPVIREVVTERLGAEVAQEAVIPDDRLVIAGALRAWSDDLGLDLILTTGGTGFAARDLTPEATRDVVERPAPGLAEAMRAASLRVTPHAMLSRADAGIRGRTLIVNLPGNPKAVRENLEAILSALPHALELLRGEKGADRHPDAKEAPPQAGPASEALPHADLLIYNASQLLTLASPGTPKRGSAMGDLGIVPNGAVAVAGGRVVAVGRSEDLLRQVRANRLLDARGHVVLPGFVDPHTHLVWAGDRADEFEMRLAGATYMQIMATGGGIMSTVRRTRAAGLDDLVAQSRARLERMLAHGSTTVEIKSGYGLDTEAEIRQLEAVRVLQAGFPGVLVPTFLGAHAVPAEYKGREEAYVDLVAGEMLPAVARAAECSPFPVRPALDVPLFCDVFCEEGAFTLGQSRRILSRARELGLGLKIHVDEFKPLGGTRLAVELGAVSADHLVCTPPEEIDLLAKSGTIAVALPGTPFGLGQHSYTPARALIEAGGAVALATDCNPGTSWCESIQFVIALACRSMRMTPAEAITASTINAAHALGLGGEVGSLEPGKRADLIVLDAPSYTHLGYRFGTNLVRTVIAGGEIVRL